MCRTNATEEISRKQTPCRKALCQIRVLLEQGLAWRRTMLAIVGLRQTEPWRLPKEDIRYPTRNWIRRSLCSTDPLDKGEIGPRSEKAHSSGRGTPIACLPFDLVGLRSLLDRSKAGLCQKTAMTF